MRHIQKIVIIGFFILFFALPLTLSALPTTGPILHGMIGVIWARHTDANPKCLEVAGASTANGADVVQRRCSDGGHQQWKFIDLGNGYYKIKNINSQKCLDVSGGSTANGANIIQWTCHNGYNQQWRIVYMGNEYYRLQARHSGKCADVAGENTANGADVIQYQCHWGYNQQWSIVGGL